MFSTRHHQKSGRKIVHISLLSPPIEAHTTHTWTSEDRPFTIPVKTPVNLNVRIIVRSFFFKVTVRILNPVITIPVTIGNVPYHHQAQCITSEAPQVHATQPLVPIGFDVSSKKLVIL